MFKIKNIKTIEPMKQNVWFFENINRMKEKLPRITKKKKHREDKNTDVKVRCESGDITTNLTEIKRIMKEYYE